MPVFAIAMLASGFLLDGSLTTEGRAGSTVQGQTPNAAAVTLDLQARSNMEDGILRLGLTPSAVFSDGSQYFARGFGQWDLRLDGTSWLRLRQGLGYGTVDLSPVAAAPIQAPGTIVVQPPPATRFVSVEESNSSIELEWGESRRLRMSGSAAWLVAGGTDSFAQQALPLGRGPQAQAVVQWAASKLDTLRFEANGRDTRYSNGLRATVASFTAGWRTQLTRNTNLSFSAGPGFGRSRTSDQPASAQPYAVATADLNSVATRDLLVSMGVSVEPLGDALSGDVVERSSARASLTLGRPGHVSVTARALGSLTLTSGSGTPTSPEAGDKFLQGELGAAVPVDQSSSLSLGVRGAWFSRPLPGQPPGQWVAFLTYVLRLPLLR
ncbi:MAG TPA: hypothetical protein VEP66_12495 [Myxococcales bacterium]|nr:hypothetical protein [Myxococcales bacterium]